MTEPLILAVVGHTNTGKTSLLRTLTRDRGFGEVSHRPSTTRHVEGARLSVDGEALLELYDTPGLEDAIALLDYLDALERPGERLDGPERMARLLDSNEARGRFEQEAKVVRQLLASDAGLYVIDATYNAPSTGPRARPPFATRPATNARRWSSPTGAPAVTYRNTPWAPTPWR